MASTETNGKNQNKGKNVLFYIIVFFLLLLIVGIIFYNKIEGALSCSGTDKVVTIKEKGSTDDKACNIDKIIKNADSLATSEKYQDALMKIQDAYKCDKAPSKEQEKLINEKRCAWFEKLKAIDEKAYTLLINDPGVKKCDKSSGGDVVSELIEKAKQEKSDGEVIINEWISSDETIKDKEVAVEDSEIVEHPDASINQKSSKPASKKKLVKKMSSNPDALENYNKAKNFLDSALSTLDEAETNSPNGVQTEAISKLKDQIIKLIDDLPVDGRIAVGGVPQSTEGMTTDKIFTKFDKKKGLRGILKYSPKKGKKGKKLGKDSEDLFEEGDGTDSKITSKKKGKGKKGSDTEDSTLIDETTDDTSDLEDNDKIGKGKKDKLTSKPKTKGKGKHKKLKTSDIIDAELTKDSGDEDEDLVISKKSHKKDPGTKVAGGKGPKPDRKLIDKSIEDQSLYPTYLTTEYDSEDQISPLLALNNDMSKGTYTTDVDKLKDSGDNTGTLIGTKTKKKRVDSKPDRDNSELTKGKKDDLLIKDRDYEVAGVREIQAEKTEKSNPVFEEKSKADSLADHLSTKEADETSKKVVPIDDTKDHQNLYICNSDPFKSYGVDPIITKPSPAIIPTDDAGNSDRYYRIGRKELSKKNYDKAHVLFEKAVSLNKDHTLAHSYWGTTFLNKNDFENALTQSKEALTRDDKEPNAHMNMGDVFYAKGNIDDAEKEFLTVIQYDKENPYAYFKLGVISLLKYKNEAGISNFKKALSINPGLDNDHVCFSNYNIALSHFRLGNYDDAVDFATKALTIKEYEPAKLLIGQAQYKKKEFENANKTLTEGLNKWKDNFDMEFTLAKSLDEQGKPDEAIKHYMNALKINAQSFEANFNIARIYLKKNNDDDSKRYFERAANLKPDDYSLNVEYGKLLLKLKRFDDAIIKFETAYKINSMKPDSYVGLGTGFHEKAKEDNNPALYDKALTYLLEAEQRTQPDFDIFKQLGNIYYFKNDLEKALSYYEKARKMEPDSYKLLKSLGSVYLKLNKYNKAIDIFESVKKLDKEGKDSELILWLSMSYFASEDYGRAKKEFKTLITKWPKYKADEQVQSCIRYLENK